MPSRLVTPVYLTPVASLTINTSAPTMARSAESRTRPLMVPLGDCASAALTSRTIKIKSGRGQRSTRDAPGMHGFIQIHPVYGSPLAFVSSFFPETRWNVGWSYLRPSRIVLEVSGKHSTNEKDSSNGRQPLLPCGIRIELVRTWITGKRKAGRCDRHPEAECGAVSRFFLCLR